MGKLRAREIAELSRLLRHRLGDLGIRVTEVRDVGAADGVEVAFAALVDQPAAITADDLGVLVTELAVEDVAVRVLVGGHAGKLRWTAKRGEHRRSPLINFKRRSLLAPRPMAGQRTLDPSI